MSHITVRGLPWDDPRADQNTSPRGGDSDDTPPRERRDVGMADEVVPRSAVGVAKLARKEGWSVRLVHATGIHIENGKPCSSLSVRAERGDRRCVALYVDGAFSDGWCGLNGLVLSLSYAETRKFLAWAPLAAEKLCCF